MAESPRFLKYFVPLSIVMVVQLSSSESEREKQDGNYVLHNVCISVVAMYAISNRHLLSLFVGEFFFLSQVNFFV